MAKKFTPDGVAKSLRVCGAVMAAEQQDCGGCVFRGSTACGAHMVAAAADLIEEQAKRIRELEAELAKIREENRWIPVEERLPENDHSVLVIVSGRIGNIHLDRAIELAEFSMDEGWVLEMWPEWENPTVTHWKPMPKGPEER